MKRHKQKSLNPDGSNKFICTLCDERVCNRKLLMGHIKAEHGDYKAKKVFDESKENDRKDIYECELCGKCFQSEQDALRHRVTHGNVDKIK